MRRLQRFFLSAVIGASWLAACGDNQQGLDVKPPSDAAVDAPAPAATGPCLDRPTNLPRPPTGALSCELLPPGFTPPRS